MEEPAPRAARAAVRAGRPKEKRPKLYLHNASTSSPGGTCGAIPSRPLRRRSWCAPLRLPAGQRRGGRARSRHSRRLRAAQRPQPLSAEALPEQTGRAGSAARWLCASERLPRGSADVNRSRQRRQGRHLEAGAAAGPRAPGPLSVRPPSRQARRPAGRLSSARAQRDSAPARSRASVPCAPPPRNRTSPGAFRNRHYVAHARTHTLSHTRTHTHTLTHTMPPRGAHSGLPLGFGAPGAILSLPLLGRGWVTSPQRPGNGGERTEGKGKPRGSRAGAGQVLGHAVLPGWRQNAGRRWAAGAGQGASPAGGWVPSRRRRRGRGAAKQRGTRLLGSGDRPHYPVPSRSSRAASPTTGRAAGSERPGLPFPSSFPPPLPTFGPAPVSAQTFSETPPERFQPKQQGPGAEGADGGREREREGAAVREAPWDL